MKLRFGNFAFDSDTRELFDGGRAAHLSPKAFELLWLLLERRPAVVSKADIRSRIWADAFVGDANLSVVVAEIRQVLGDDSKDARFIRTVHRVGYAFCGAASADPLVPRAPGASLLADLERADVPAGGRGERGGSRPALRGVGGWIGGVAPPRQNRGDAGEVAIEDLASSNGTFVGGRRLASAQRLGEGDVIELGSEKMTFRLWSDERPQKTDRIARPRSRKVES